MFQALPPALWNTQQFAVILLSFIYSDYKAPVLRDVGQRASTTPTQRRFLEIRAQNYNPADFQNTNRNNSVQITQLGTVFNIAVTPSSTLTFSPHLVFPEPLFPGGGCSPGTTSPGLSWLLACFHGHFPQRRAPPDFPFWRLLYAHFILELILNHMHQNYVLNLSFKLRNL